YREALATLDAVERVSPNQPSTALLESTAWFALGAYDSAAIACERALRLDPRASGGLERLGFVRLAQSRPADARAGLGAALRREPARLELARERGLASYVMGDTAAARADYTLAGAPRSSPLALLGARVWLGIGLPGRAREVLGRAAGAERLDPALRAL